MEFAVVRGRHRAMALHWLLKSFLLFVTDRQIVAKPTAEEAPALLAADLNEILVMIADQLLLRLHEFGLGSSNRCQL